jgi:MFS family permease
MRFFDNSTINLTYIHSALQTFAENAGGVFVFVFLLKAGLSVPIVFCTLATIFLLRISLRRTVLPVVRRVGLRGGLIIGTVMIALSYILVAGIQGLGPRFVILILCDALGTSFYWTCYHSYVAKLGDVEHRGAQVSVREAINAIMGIGAPLIGGFLLIYGNSFYAFGLAATVEALAIVPLLFAPNYQIAAQAEISIPEKWAAQKLFFTDGVITSTFFFVWIIALFKTLGESFGSYGSALALAGVIGAVMSLGVGRMIDLGHHKRSVQIAYGAIALSIIIKALGFTAPWSAVAANASGAIAAALYVPVLFSRIYNMAKRSACPLRFQVAAEGAWDLGTGLGCLVAALLSYFALSYFWPLILGLAGVFAGYQIIQRVPD